MTDAVRAPDPTRVRLRLPWAIPERAGGLSMAGVLAAAGLFFVLQSAAMDIGSLREPGPGFVPLGLGALLALFAVAIVIDTLRAQHEPVPVDLGHRDVLVVFGCLVAVPEMFEPVGAYLTLGLFTAVVLILVGRVRLWQAAFGSTLAMIATWGFFGHMLGLRLPQGLLTY